MRTHWKFRAALAALLVVAVVAAWLMVRSGMAHERKEFVSDSDPITGYRCRFTVSSDWKIERGSGEALGMLSFTAPPPNPVRKWMNQYLLHHPASKPATIYAVTTNMPTISGSFTIVAGYPEVAWFPSKSLVHTHLQVDGHPTTLDRVEVLSAGKEYQISSLLVYFPEQSGVYNLYSTAEPSDADQAFRELQQVSASFHVEKAAVPTGGKR